MSDSIWKTPWNTIKIIGKEFWVKVMGCIPHKDRPSFCNPGEAIYWVFGIIFYTIKLITIKGYEALQCLYNAFHLSLKGSRDAPSYLAIITNFISAIWECLPSPPAMPEFLKNLGGVAGHMLSPEERIVG
jgi:hypothetical protein